MHPSELSAPPRVPLPCEIEIEPADHSSHLPVVRSRSHRRVPVSVAMDATDVPRPCTSGGGGGIELAVKPPGQGSADSGGQRNNRSPINSIGFLNPSRLRGRSLSSAATQLRSAALWTDRSLPFGKYCRSNPFDAPMFVKLPRGPVLVGP